MQILRTLIVEDEYWQAREMRRLVSAHAGFDVVGIVDNGNAAVSQIRCLRPDVVLLDIMIPGMSGVQIAQQVTGVHMPQIIFITAYENYAIKAFELNAADYLMKPVSQIRLNDALSKARSRAEAGLSATYAQNSLKNVSEATAHRGSVAEHRNIVVSKATTSEQYEIAVSTIVWVDAAGDYMCIFTHSDTYILRTTMKQLLNDLGDKQFIRIHRSCLINLAMVESLTPLTKGDYLATLYIGETLKVSRSYAESVLKAHRNFLTIPTVTE